MAPKEAAAARREGISTRPWPARGPFRSTTETVDRTRSPAESPSGVAPAYAEAAAPSGPSPRRKHRSWAAIAAVAAAGFLSAFVGKQFMDLPDPGPVRQGTVPTEAAGVAFPGLGGAAAARTEANLTVRIGAESALDRVEGLVAAMREAGFVVELSRVPFRIQTTRVGYFHPEDRTAAEALRAALASSDLDEVDLRDYGGALAGPPPGSLEVWIEG